MPARRHKESQPSEPEPQTWRQLLGSAITDPRKKEELSRYLGVHPITLQRWVQGETHPRPPTLRQLLVALPEHREQLTRLIEVEFTGVLQQWEGEREIPASFYKQIADGVVLTPEAMGFWSLSNTLLQQALQHLDPERMGMELTIALCMPPREGGKIRSLRERVGIGTPPWRADFAEKETFLGAESLAGQAMSAGHRMVAQTDDHRGSIPLSNEKGLIQSLAAFPLAKSGRVAGCLQVLSAIPEYFTPLRIDLLQDYANLIVLALLHYEPFYEPLQLELRWMPPPEVQRTFLDSRHLRVAQVLREALLHEESMTKIQADNLVYQQIEEELIGYEVAQSLSDKDQTRRAKP